MNWDDLRIFLAVARGRGLSGGARTLRLDPATAGRRIARLEDSLGSALFTRSPQGYDLTEAGARLLEHAERMEAEAEGAAETLGASEGLTGSLRIGAPDGCANFLLPQVTRRLMEENPGLEIQVLALPRIVNLSRREADMAIAVSRPTAGRLMVQKVADYRLSLAASAGYLARSSPIRSVADLREHPMVGYIPDMIFDKELDYLAGLGIDTPSFASNSVSVQLHWLKAGAGVGIVHDFALPEAPGLVRILPEAVRLERTFWLVRHEGDKRSNRLQRLAEAVSRGLRDEIARTEAELDRSAAAASG